MFLYSTLPLYLLLPIQSAYDISSNFPTHRRTPGLIDISTVHGHHPSRPTRFPWTVSYKLTGGDASICRNHLSTLHGFNARSIAQKNFGEFDRFHYLDAVLFSKLWKETSRVSLSRYSAENNWSTDPPTFHPRGNFIDRCFSRHWGRR